jgi:nucleotide-binding universal stress UspA family protein
MFKRILVPLDGSARAEQAIPTAGRIARATGGSVVLLRVTLPPVNYGYGPYMLQPAFTVFDQGVQEALKVIRRKFCQGFATILGARARIR